MDRIHLPKLTSDQLGKDGVIGWYFEPSTRDDGKEWIIVQCPNNHRASIKNHSVKQDGEVNASFLCIGNCGWHVWVVLDGWNDNYIKKAGDWYPIEETYK